MEIERKVMATNKKEKGRQWDGVSRPSDDKYRTNFDRIFGKKKTLHELAMEGYEEEKKLNDDE
tara:strand:+ start:2624 stop:2812 length:189 start_codon:yes stop_codon:yes gene_type:complete